MPAEALATTTQAITTPRELRLALPAGTKLHDIAVGASGSLQIGSNTSLRSETGFATAGSSGAGDTALATDAAVGNLFSQGPVRLGTRARVNGDLKTAASSVEQKSGATVTGTLQVGATLTPVQPLAWTIAFEPSAVDVKPPIPIDCLAPVRWRNNVCFDATVAPTEAVTEFGVEYDWMGFLYSVNTEGADRASMDDLFGIHRAACGGPCGGKDQVLRPRLVWDACTGTGCAPGVAGLSGGARQCFDTTGRPANGRQFIDSGSTFGVDRNVRR